MVSRPSATARKRWPRVYEVGDKGSREKDGRQESYICRVKINLSASDLGHCSPPVEHGREEETAWKCKRTVKIQMHMWRLRHA